ASAFFIHASSSFEAYRAHRGLPSFPTRRSSDLMAASAPTRLDCACRSSFASSASAAKTVPLASCAASGRPSRRVATCSLRHWLRSEEHTSELQSRENLVCRLLLEKKKNTRHTTT